ncbi:MAG: VOC family protein [Patescibacteria group bacterium]
MSSPILGLRTAIYKVPDLEKAKEWYSKVFQAEPYFDEAYYVGFNIGGFELGLQPETVPVGENVAVFWGVEDIEKEYQRFLEQGATEVEKPMNVGGSIMVATLKDPWGNLLGLIYNPEFKGFGKAD